LKDHDGLDLGLHLNLTDRMPMTTKMRDRLTPWGGRFPSKFAVAKSVMAGYLGLGDIKQEWRAQIERCLDQGLAIRFVNSHEHIHMLPPLFRLTCELAHEYGIGHVRMPASRPFRNPQPGALVRDTLIKALAVFNKKLLRQPAPVFLGMTESGRLDLAALRKILPRLRTGGIYELMCHPGFRGEGEIDNPALIEYHDWEGELNALTSEDTKNLLRTNNIRLIGYRNLDCRDGRLTITNLAH